MLRVSCREYEDALREMARGGPATPHVSECAACRDELRRQKRLNAAMGILAAEASGGAPARVEQMLLAKIEIGRQRRRRFAYGMGGGAIAASLAIALLLQGRWSDRPVSVPPQELASNRPVSVPTELSVAVPAQPVVRPHVRRKPARPQQEQPFIAIPYTLPFDPYERVDVMRVDVPVTALIAAGLPMKMVDPGAQARADLLLGQDGRARAVRLIAISTAN